MQSSVVLGVRMKPETLTHVNNIAKGAGMSRNATITSILENSSLEIVKGILPANHWDAIAKELMANVNMTEVIAELMASINMKEVLAEMVRISNPLGAIMDTQSTDETETTDHE